MLKHRLAGARHRGCEEMVDGLLCFAWIVPLDITDLAVSLATLGTACLNIVFDYMCFAYMKKKKHAVPSASETSC